MCLASDHSTALKLLFPMYERGPRGVRFTNSRTFGRHQGGARLPAPCALANHALCQTNLSPFHSITADASMRYVPSTHLLSALWKILFSVCWIVVSHIQYERVSKHTRRRKPITVYGQKPKILTPIPTVTNIATKDLTFI